LERVFTQLFDVTATRGVVVGRHASLLGGGCPRHQLVVRYARCNVQVPHFVPAPPERVTLHSLLLPGGRGTVSRRSSPTTTGMPPAFPRRRVGPSTLPVRVGPRREEAQREMAEGTTRRPLPALVCLLALTLLTALVWWRVLNRSDSHASSTHTCSSTAAVVVLPRPNGISVTVLNSTTRSQL